MTETGRRKVRTLISGRVQGVWYRAWTEKEARARGLSGWVRNRRDGAVEALFSGPDDRVAEMLEACREGPPAARVGDIQAEDIDTSAGDLVEGVFRVLPTA